MNNENLIELAIEARKNAKSSTKYYVGAALLTKSGKVYTGCNLGSENGLFNICAERVAIVKMLSEGEEKIEKIAVVGGKEDELTYTTPCGACRQFLADFGIELEVIMGYMEDNELKEKVFKLKDLLPETYVF